MMRGAEDNFVSGLGITGCIMARRGGCWNGQLAESHGRLTGIHSGQPNGLMAGKPAALLADCHREDDYFIHSSSRIERAPTETDATRLMIQLFVTYCSIFFAELNHKISLFAVC